MLGGGAPLASKHKTLSGAGRADASLNGQAGFGLIGQRAYSYNLTTTKINPDKGKPLMPKSILHAQKMHLTADHVARVDRLEPDPGPRPGTREPDESDFARFIDNLLEQHLPEDLWVFAYGSLIWNPEFEFEEMRTATARGWHRSFCLKLTRWRGTRQLPGLMLALDHGGSCKGLVFRLPAKDHYGQLLKLMRREVGAIPATNVPRWIKVGTESGPLLALAFVADTKGPAYAGKQAIEQVAQVLARAAGHWGSAAQYLYNTVSRLEDHGIRDKNLWEIQKLVAREIDDAL
jgi:glutathione-specific gamma-glutamylcyclotransferase